MIDSSSIRSHLPSSALLQVEGLPYPRIASGKVRDIFAVGDSELLLIASDRLSAFDVVLPDGIPGKGIILTQISLYWFEETRNLIANHLVPDHDARLAEALKGHESLIPRSMLVRRLKTLPIEAVARGYLSGSGWRNYLLTGKLFGLPVPSGLRESEKLPVPLFTPTTKAAGGDHDEPMTQEEGAALLGKARYEEVRDLSLELFALGTAFARRAGLILADTKFEFGTDESGKLFLADEVLTPDSSRFWPIERYAPGGPQPSFDKQYVRDYLETLAWDKTPPGPALTPEVISQTVELYLAAFDHLVTAEIR
jgi:phosphoribosylaminoimidazole-succinocarboxamide synthase